MSQCLQVSLTPIKDAGGFITNYVAVLQDVTERKSSEAAFKLRDHALSNLSEASLCISIAGSPSCMPLIQTADLQGQGFGVRPEVGGCLYLNMTASQTFCQVFCTWCLATTQAAVPQMSTVPSSEGLTSVLALQGITIADPNLPDCPLMYVNEAFCRMTGYDQDEILGRNCRFLQGPETDKAALARIKIAMQQVRHLEYMQ